MDPTDERQTPDRPVPDPTGGAGDLPAQRSCTRCDGRQHLIAHGAGMGKYRCDTCEMIVGYDLETADPEFLIDRGLPSRYTKRVFGTELTGGERRIEPRVPAER